MSKISIVVLVEIFVSSQRRDEGGQVSLICLVYCRVGRYELREDGSSVRRVVGGGVGLASRKASSRSRPVPVFIGGEG